MKHFKHLLTFVFLAALLLVVVPAFAQDLTESLEIEDWDFTMQYPEDWELVVDDSNPAIVFYQMVDPDADVNNVIVFFIPGGLDTLGSLDTAAEQLAEGFRMDFAFDAEITLGGNDAVLYRHYDAEFDQGGLIVAADIEGDHLLMMALIAGENGIDTETLYRQMLNTVEIAGEGSDVPQLEGDARQGDSALGYGDRVDGEITDDRPFVFYTFEGSAGDVVRISMEATSGDLDTHLTLLDEDNDIVAENDDVERGNTDSLIEVELPADGIYTIGASRYNFDDGDSAGEYVLTLELVDASSGDGGAEDEGAAGSADVIVLEYGDAVEGEITDAQYFVLYSFEGAESDIVQISVEALDGDLDTYVALVDANGDIIAENDDARRGSTDSYLEFELPEDGIYTIIVTRYQFDEGSSTGVFSLTLDAE